MEMKTVLCTRTHTRVHVHRQRLLSPHARCSNEADTVDSHQKLNKILTGSVAMNISPMYAFHVCLNKICVLG